MTAPPSARPRESRRPRAALVAGALSCVSCGQPSLGVPLYPHPDYAAEEPIAFLPPPARVEHLRGEPPGVDCRWVDGQWLWIRQRWEWQGGRWVLPPEECHYSAASFHWVAGGSADEKRDVLYYRPGRWYSVTERRVCPSVPTCPGTESLDPARAPHDPP